MSVKSITSILGIHEHQLDIIINQYVHISAKKNASINV